MCLCVPGEREAVGPGEEIPQLDGGEELPQVLLGNERGERSILNTHTRKHSVLLACRQKVALMTHG